MSDDAIEIISPLSAVESWRAIVLYGQNTATYKIALGKCLAKFVQSQQDTVPMVVLAEAFLAEYEERLADGSDRPQLLTPGRLTVLERIVAELNLGAIDRSEAIDRVARDGFGDVVPRFHTLGRAQVPVQFYHATRNSLVLTDEAFRVVDSTTESTLIEELRSRWDLLEAAFALKRIGDAKLVNDVRRFYIARGYARTNVTPTRPVLAGYQQGRCFYCGEEMDVGDVHVDHVIPRQFIRHDEIWNLVLAHALCNERKSDALPSAKYIDRLVVRNEHFIASNHPIRARLIASLGTTPEARRATIVQVYADARLVLGSPWNGPTSNDNVGGTTTFDPENDLFYRSIVRRLAR